MSVLRTLRVHCMSVQSLDNTVECGGRTCACAVDAWPSYLARTLYAPALRVYSEVRPATLSNARFDHVCTRRTERVVRCGRCASHGLTHSQHVVALRTLHRKGCMTGNTTVQWSHTRLACCSLGNPAMHETDKKTQYLHRASRTADMLYMCSLSRWWLIPIAMLTSRTLRYNRDKVPHAH